MSDRNEHTHQLTPHWKETVMALFKRKPLKLLDEHLRAAEIGWRFIGKTALNPSQVMDNMGNDILSAFDAARSAGHGVEAREAIANARNKPVSHENSTIAAAWPQFIDAILQSTDPS